MTVPDCAICGAIAPQFRRPPQALLVRSGLAPNTLMRAALKALIDRPSGITGPHLVTVLYGDRADAIADSRAVSKALYGLRCVLEPLGWTITRNDGTQWDVPHRLVRYSPDPDAPPRAPSEKELHELRAIRAAGVIMPVDLGWALWPDQEMTNKQARARGLPVMLRLQRAGYVTVIRSENGALCSPRAKLTDAGYRALGEEPEHPAPVWQAQPAAKTWDLIVVAAADRGLEPNWMVEEALRNAAADNLWDDLIDA